MAQLLTFRELRKVLHPHYIVNLLLALSYIILKNLRPLCSMMFNECGLDHRELEILVYTGVIIIFRTRKQGAINLLPYIETACMFAKMGTVVLYFYSDPIYAIVFMIICLMHLLWLPEPSYKGPESVTYFTGNDFEEELEKDKSVTWFIEFYAPWSPACVDFSSVFSELSVNFSTKKLRFGKVDLSRNPQAGVKYRINTSSMSKELPTLILFVDGKVNERRPLIASNNKAISFSFTYETIVIAFDLNGVYAESKLREKGKQPQPLPEIEKKTN